MSRQSDYITLVRQANRDLWDAINTLVAAIEALTGQSFTTETFV